MSNLAFRSRQKLNKTDEEGGPHQSLKKYNHIIYNKTDEEGVPHQSLKKYNHIIVPL